MGKGTSASSSIHTHLLRTYTHTIHTHNRRLWRGCRANLHLFLSSPSWPWPEVPARLASLPAGARGYVVVRSGGIWRGGVRGGVQGSYIPLVNGCVCVCVCVCVCARARARVSKRSTVELYSSCQWCALYLCPPSNTPHTSFSTLVCTLPSAQPRALHPQRSIHAHTSVKYVQTYEHTQLHQGRQMCVCVRVCV